MARSERVLLEAEQPEIFKQELQQAFGVVKTARLVVKDERVGSPTITTLPVEDGKTVRVRTIAIARQVGGTSGTVGNSASWELVGTFKRIGNTLSQVGSTTFLVTHEDDADWGIRYEVTENLLYLQGEFNGPTDSLGLHVVFNTYSFIHTLVGSA